MTSFKIVTDDVGVRGIQEGNKTPVISGPVMPVKASNPVQKSPENLPLQPGQIDRGGGSEAHHVQRRYADRRKTDTTVVVETRSQHDRRTKNEKKDDSENADTVTTLHGIDEIV